MVRPAGLGSLRRRSLEHSLDTQGLHKSRQPRPRRGSPLLWSSLSGASVVRITGVQTSLHAATPAPSKGAAAHFSGNALNCAAANADILGDRQHALAGP